MKYRKIGGAYFGFIDISISRFAEHFQEYFGSFSMLITCIDSTPQVSSLKKWMNYIKSKKWDFKVIGNSIWIPSRYVLEVLSEGQTFYGFDELFLLKRLPTEGIDDERVYTTDSYNFGRHVPNEFVKKFNRLGATRYLADGCGMNFACESIEIVKRIRKIEQAVL